MMDKLNANTIDWTDSRVTTLETMKYQKANNVERTQESMITFLANLFKPVDIKVAFTVLIGKVGGSALKQRSIHCHLRGLNWWKVFLNWYLMKSPCWLIL